MAKKDQKEPAAEDEQQELKFEPVNLGDTAHIKRTLDDAASQYILDQGYPEDFSTSNMKIFIGAVTCAFALVAQFYPKKFPDNWWVLVGCVAGYGLFNGLLTLFSLFIEKDAVLFSYPKEDAKEGEPGIILSTQLPRFTDMFTMKIGARNGGGREETLVKSVSAWFDVDGFLAEDIFRADVAVLLAAYHKSESRKTK